MFFDERISYIRPRRRRSSWLSEKRRVKRVSRNGGCCEDRVCGSSGHCTGLFGSRFQGSLLLTGPSSLRLPIPLCRLSSDPPSRGVFSPLCRSSGSLLILLVSDLLSVSLVCAQIAALRRDILSVLFWGTSGGWHADKGNLLAQKILSQEARGWLAHAVRLIYLLLVSDVECL